MAIETEVEFPRGMRDLYPDTAQKLYIDTYKQSWAKLAESTNNALSREGLASRDAWNAVRREFMEDPDTHKWRRVGEQAPAAQAGKRSVMGTLKGLFKR